MGIEAAGAGVRDATHVRGWDLGPEEVELWGFEKGEMGRCERRVTSWGFAEKGEDPARVLTAELVNLILQLSPATALPSGVVRSLRLETLGGL